MDLSVEALGNPLACFNPSRVCPVNEASGCPASGAPSSPLQLANGLDGGQSRGGGVHAPHVATCCSMASFPCKSAVCKACVVNGGMSSALSSKLAMLAMRPRSPGLLIASLAPCTASEALASATLERQAALRVCIATCLIGDGLVCRGGGGEDLRDLAGDGEVLGGDAPLDCNALAALTMHDASLQRWVASAGDVLDKDWARVVAGDTLLGTDGLLLVVVGDVAPGGALADLASGTVGRAPLAGVRTDDLASRGAGGLRGLAAPPLGASALCGPLVATGLWETGYAPLLRPLRPVDTALLSCCFCSFKATICILGCGSFRRERMRS
mmetsp:Transcript_50572/g.93522  ORF Transcript_50572/g.93522 Transcript_50572/m.93522 type:complete len:326 (-) Transcript_50572:518-1495(-)